MDKINYDRNERGKQLIQTAKLEYSRAILDYLKKDPDILDNVLDDLEMTKDDFQNRIIKNNDNISFYDQAYCSIQKELSLKYSKTKEK